MNDGVWARRRRVRVTRSHVMVGVYLRAEMSSIIERRGTARAVPCLAHPLSRGRSSGGEERREQDRSRTRPNIDRFCPSSIESNHTSFRASRSFLTYSWTPFRRALALFIALPSLRALRSSCCFRKAASFSAATPLHRIWHRYICKRDGSMIRTIHKRLWTRGSPEG